MLRRRIADRKYVLTHPGYNRKHNTRWSRENRERRREINRLSARRCRRGRRRRRTPQDYLASRRRKLSRYDLTVEQYEAMLREQGHACAICRHRPAPNKHLNYGVLCVDHDHRVPGMRVRGLLCSRCNYALGLADEDPLILLNMIEYLFRHQRAVTSASSTPSPSSIPARPYP